MTDNHENDDKPGIEEQYTRATTTSNLRMDTRDGSPRSAADIIMAAGWSDYRIGGALLRLHTEFDGSEKPRLATRDDFMRPGQHDRDARKAASRQAHEFNLHELGLLLQKLKSLPAVRTQLTLQMLKWKVEDAEVKAVGVLRWWLSQACPECGGTKFKVAEGTGRHTAKACTLCSGTGKRAFPGSYPETWEQQARRLANFMDQCVERARAGISRHMGSSTGRSADMIKDRCRAILAKNPSDSAARKTLDALEKGDPDDPVDTDVQQKA